MKGFIPVSKQALETMLANCREALEADMIEKVDERASRYIATEKERCSIRRWYRLWILPKPRFDFDDASIREYSAGRSYEMFDGDPFMMLKKDYDNSVKWLNRIERMAMSEFAGEPIQLDVDTFDRLSNPDRFHWVNIGLYYTLR